MKKVKHAVVLVNFNGWQDTVVCVNSIRQAKDAPHVIVVDNGSPNESVAKIKQAFPGLDLITSPVNVGFSAGNNLGIKRALKLGAKVVYLLNNDTVVAPALFARAYRYVAGKSRLAGGKIYYARGHEFHANQKGRGDVLWYAGGSFDQNNIIAVHRGVDELDHGQYDQILPVGFITGCFIAIPRRVLNKIGFLDESLFLYLEDLDYCLRALSREIELTYNPRLVLYHTNASSTVAGSALVDYYHTRNRFVIARRYCPPRRLLSLVKEALTRNWRSPLRRLAFFDYLSGRMGNQNDQIFALVAKMAK